MPDPSLIASILVVHWLVTMSPGANTVLVAQTAVASGRVNVLAVIAGIYAYNSHLRWTQWVGVVAIIATVSLLPVQRRRKMVKVPAPAPSPA